MNTNTESSERLQRTETLPVIQVFRPYLREDVIQAAVDVMRSGWLGTGPKTKQFEQEFKNYLETPGSCVATMSATSALELAMNLLEIEAGDEIITTPITFVSTNHVILYANAIPVFADVDKHTGNILPASIEARITDKTKAIVVVHLSGYACDMEKIEGIAEKYNLKIIEDCAHAAGGVYHNGKHKNKKIGSSNNICCFSFQAVKNISCGDGGMLVLPAGLKQRAMQLRWMGIDKDTFSRTNRTGEYLWKYDVPELGIRANPNDIMSAMGVAQLKYVEVDNARRRTIATFYKDKLSVFPDITLPDIDIAQSACHFYPVYVKDRDGLLSFLSASNIFVGVHYRRNDKYASYITAELPNAEYIENHTITLPIHLLLTDADLQRIVDTIETYYSGI
jgi:perosamine synthetase